MDDLWMRLEEIEKKNPALGTGKFYFRFFLHPHIINGQYIHAYIRG